jgi:hypothetical protein
MGILNDIYKARKAFFKKGDYFYLDDVPGEKGRLVAEGFCDSDELYSLRWIDMDVDKIKEKISVFNQIGSENINKNYLVLYRSDGGAVFSGNKTVSINNRGRLKAMNFNSRVIIGKHIRK